MLIYIFYFNYYMNSDAYHHLAAVFLSKRYPDIFIFSPLAPASIFHLFAYFISTYINEPYAIVFLFSLISVPLLAYSIYLFLKSRNAYSFYFYAASFIISASFFTFHYMPAWAFSQIVFFLFLALDFNFINAIISVPIFYVTHPLIGFLYYGIRAIESFEKKETKNIYYSILCAFLLFIISAYYIYISKYNQDNIDYYRDIIYGGWRNFSQNLALPFFTLYAVMGFALFFYLFKTNSVIRVQYLFLLSLFFIIPFVGGFFYISSRITAPFIIYAIAIANENKNNKELASFFSMLFILSFLLIITLPGIFPDIKAMPDLTLAYFNCNHDLTNKIISGVANDKLVFFYSSHILCIYSILKETPVFSYNVIMTHPIRPKKDIKDLTYYLTSLQLDTFQGADILLLKQYCEIFNDSISYITNEENLTNIYKSSSIEDGVFIIKPCEAK